MGMEQIVNITDEYWKFPNIEHSSMYFFSYLSFSLISHDIFVFLMDKIHFCLS